MQGVLVNVGDPSPCASLHEWQIRWIREQPQYRAVGLRYHHDPEFETFTYGDYPWKPAKANLAKMGVGDWIFFNETLVVGGVKARYLIACFRIAERLGFEELVAGGLLQDPRFVGNAHVRRHWLLPGSDTRFAIWRGGPGSRLLAHPVLIDRQFIESLGLADQDGRPWDWNQRDRNGRAFTQLQLIGFHTRATRRLDERQTAWLLGRLERLPVQSEAPGSESQGSVQG